MRLPTFVERSTRLDKILALQKRGVVFIDKESAYIEDSVTIGANTVIWPNVYILGKTKIGKNCVIGPNAYLKDVILNPGVEIRFDCEVKRSFLGSRVKAHHFCYIGDAKIGRDCNIGAGAVFCNYNGINKNISVLEPEVFVGSGTMVVPPIKIGRGAYIAAQSVVTKDVPAGGTLVIARGGEEIHKPNRYRKTRRGWEKRRSSSGNHNLPAY